MSLRKLVSVVGANKNVSIYPSLIGLSTRKRWTYDVDTQIIRRKSDKVSLREDTVKDKKNYDEDDDENKPIKFSDSAAATWNPVYSRTGGALDDRPWYQTYVVLASTASFLIYFCILREENDIDQKLTLQLSDHFEGDRKVNIQLSQQLPDEVLRRGN